MNGQLLIFVGIGLVTIAFAALDVEWFMSHRKARLFVDMFGRDGARVFYMIIGAAIAIGGFMICG